MSLFTKLFKVTDMIPIFAISHPIHYAFKIMYLFNIKLTFYKYL